MNCQDVEVPAKDYDYIQELAKELCSQNEQECLSCHCLELYVCPDCGKCKVCNKKVPIRFWEGTTVPRLHPYNPFPYPLNPQVPNNPQIPVNPLNSPHWVEPNTTIICENK